MFDIKNVADGFARNYLIPNGLAKIADDKSIQEIAKEKAIREKRETELKAALLESAKKLSDKEFTIRLKIGKGGEVFGSITKERIKEIIRSGTAHISNNDLLIDLVKPIKTLGQHQVEIDLGKGVKTKIKIFVSGQR